MTCKHGCQFPSSNSAQPACASTTQSQSAPCKAPSYARACLTGDPTMSPLQLERAARSEHLWTRDITFTIDAAGDYSFVDVLFESFTHSGGACLKNVSLTITDALAAVQVVPVDIVGIAGVWDFTDSTQVWTERVAIPCEAETLGIQTTAGRCPCELECEGCLYPAGVGGAFMVRYRFPTVTLSAAQVPATAVATATGRHSPTPPCCVLPVLLNEAARVAGALPQVQDIG